MRNNIDTTDIKVSPGDTVTLPEGDYIVQADGSLKPAKPAKAATLDDLERKIQRVEDNVDFVQNSTAVGTYIRASKPGTPTGPPEGGATFLRDGGAEATTFAEVENIQLNKKGAGPYGDFSDVKKGDWLSIQSNKDGAFGVYIVRNSTDLSTYWDFGLDIASGRSVGDVPEMAEEITVRTSRPVFTVSQDTPPDLSQSGQLWHDTTNNSIKVWNDDAGDFFSLGGEVAISDVAPTDVQAGALWFNSDPKELTLYVFDGVDWIPAAPPVSLDGIDARLGLIEPIVQAQQEAVSRLNKISVDQQQRLNTDDGRIQDLEDTRVKKAGDTITGQLTIKGEEFRVTKDGISMFRVRPDTGFVVYDGTGTNNNHLINKKQIEGIIDDKISAIPEPPDAPEPDVDKDYVDKQDALRVLKSGDTVDGDLGVKGKLTVDGSHADMTATVRVKGTLVVKKDGEAFGGANIFEVSASNAIYSGPITKDNNIATRKFVLDNAGSSDVTKKNTAGWDGAGKRPVFTASDGNLYVSYE